MTTLYNGQLFIQGLTLYTAAQGMGITTSDTIVSVLNSITNNTSQKVMLEIGSCNMNLGNKGSVYKYLLGMSNRTDGLGGEFHIQSLASLTTSPYASATPITRFMINASGNVGIGTTTPAYLLDVNGTTRLNGATIVNGETTITGATIINGTTVVAADAAYSNVSTGQDTNKYAQFTIAQPTRSGRLYFATTYTGGGGAASVIQSSDYYSDKDNGMNLCLNPLGGYVGVNTKVPAYNLDVTGTTRLNGATSVTGTTELNGQTNLNGAARFSKDVWNTSSDAAFRLFFAGSGCSYFGSGDGTFRFRNKAQNVDNVVIDNAGNMNVVGSISATNVKNTFVSAGTAGFTGNGDHVIFYGAPLPKTPGLYALFYHRTGWAAQGMSIKILAVWESDDPSAPLYQSFGLYDSWANSGQGTPVIEAVSDGSRTSLIGLSSAAKYSIYTTYYLACDLYYHGAEPTWYLRYRQIV